MGVSSPLRSAPGYHDPGALDRVVRDHAEQAGPRVRRRVLGASVEGRDLEAWTVAPVGEVPDPARPQFVVLAGIHGCEVIATEVGLDLFGRLCAEVPDPAAADVLARGDVTYVPTANPDSRAASFERLARGGRWVGAPRRNTNGVDLNRNFPWLPGVRDHWLPVSGSNSRRTPWYRGPSPCSEPETRAVMALAEELAPTALLNLHSTGQILTYPWSAMSEPSPCEPGFLAMTAAFTAAQGMDTYRVKQSNAWYPIVGNSNDWFHHTFGTLAITVETSPRVEAVRQDRRRAPWVFWWNNPIDRDAWVGNDVPGCLAALVAAHEWRVAHPDVRP